MSLIVYTCYRKLVYSPHSILANVKMSLNVAIICAISHCKHHNTNMSLILAAICVLSDRNTPVAIMRLISLVMSVSVLGKNRLWHLINIGDKKPCKGGKSAG